MRSLTIHDVPDSLYDRLEARAAAQDRSLEIEALTILERACRGRPTSAGTILEGMGVVRGWPARPARLRERSSAAP